MNMQFDKSIQLMNNNSLDSRYVINSLSEINTIIFPYIGMPFYSKSEKNRYVVDTIKNGYQYYSDNIIYPEIKPNTTELIDYEVIPNYFIDTYHELVNFIKTDFSMTVDNNILKLLYGNNEICNIDITNPDIHIGPDAPPTPNKLLWIDTDEDYSADNSYDNSIKRYSVRFTGSLANGVREDDAVGMIAEVAVGSTTVINNFDSVPFFNRPICCCTYDTVNKKWIVNAYKGEPGFAWDGSNGEVMYENTPFYYKAIFETDSAYISVAGYPLKDYKLSPLFKNGIDKVYCPVFNLSMVNNVASSRSGVFPQYGSLDSFMADAHTFNENAHLETMESYFNDCLLLWVEFATRDWQSIMLGACTLSYNSALTKIASVNSTTSITMDTGTAANFVAGQTVSIGSTQNGSNRTSSVKIQSIDGDIITLSSEVTNMAIGDYLSSRMYECGAAATTVTNASSGSPASNTNGKYPCIWRGKENPWANGYSTICNVLIGREGVEGSYTYPVYYLPNINKYSGGLITNEYIKTSLNLNTSDGYTKTINGDTVYPFIFGPSSIGASSTNYYSAYYYYPRYEVTAVRVGGYFANGRDCGLCFFCYGRPSYSHIYCAARLLVTS